MHHVTLQQYVASEQDEPYKHQHCALLTLFVKQCHWISRSHAAQAARLKEALAEGRVLVSEQAPRNVGVGHLQEVEARLQPQADALLRQQRPAASARRASENAACIRQRTRLLPITGAFHKKQQHMTHATDEVTSNEE